jgi:DNA-binding NarL/FixJ family response regulator
MTSSGLSIAQKAKRHRPSVKPLRVLISAASSITRAGLERLLEDQPTLHLVGAISSSNELPQAIADNDPDVVLIHLEAHSGETSWEELIALAVPIVLLAGEADLVRTMTALAGGVQAILLGDATGTELAAAANSAAAGLLALSAGLPISYGRVSSLMPARRPSNPGEAPILTPTLLQNTSPFGSGRCSR